VLVLAFGACSGDDDDLPGSMAGTTAGVSGTSGGCQVMDAGGDL
jgi:hypothetical protein